MQNASQPSSPSCMSEQKSLEDKAVDVFLESNTEALVTSKDIPEVSINQKITYKQKMKQSLRNELSACIKSNCSWDKIVFDIEIPEFSLETILTGIQDLGKLQRKI
ncbi:unnamed protein product [Rhizophagus irregularis]|nr:unnamed protein product [Rhizophagus irregularis]